MHRWLLLSYPRDYRRERGAEILETVQDVAPTSRRARVAANLVRHGLRARLGRPASRSVVVWASIFAVVCGLFAASFATWLTWVDSRPLDHDELAGAVGHLYPDQQVSHLDRDDPPSAFTIYGQPLSWSSASDLLLGDGGEYSLAVLGASFEQLPAGRPLVLAELRQRLQAAGWDDTEPVYSNAYDCIPDDPRCDPASIPADITVYAKRGDNVLEVHINADNTTPVMDFAMTRSTPSSSSPAGVVAFVLGASSGWCLFGWASRRTEGGHPAAQGTAKFLYGFAMFLWWAPILLSAPQLLSHQLSEPHVRWHPLWEWLGQPVMSLPFLLGCLMLTLALGLAALPHRQPADRTLAHG
ncbi:hypothetical protein MRQ36_00815 [Micromonospora sp. R77]|uniref:hypothetical protein n=1 Tax=Micromonospora sp. R77 TaxID=2925836 RepID=UPI001F60F2C5|nr:hypothetical protein [Micromonospora sp. R77]MCI4061189.1 hypothetical protein [Micromonospora sp. R77]